MGDCESNLNYGVSTKGGFMKRDSNKRPIREDFRVLRFGIGQAAATEQCESTFRWTTSRDLGTDGGCLQQPFITIALPSARPKGRINAGLNGCCRI